MSFRDYYLSLIGGLFITLAIFLGGIGGRFILDNPLPLEDVILYLGFSLGIGLFASLIVLIINKEGEE